MIGPDSAPRLARAARLRYDRIAGRMMLLAPERGLVLNESAAAIVALCTGEHRVRDVADRLHQALGISRERVERDVLDFLHELERRRLLEEAR